MKKKPNLLKLLILFMGFIFIQGCNHLPKPKRNLILEVEIDLLLLEEMATLLRLNHIMLTRMDVSVTDPWPEILLDYRKKSSGLLRFVKKPPSGYRAYEDCLLRQLKEDYSFFKIYNYAEYRSIVGGVFGGLGGRLTSLCPYGTSFLALKLALDLGRRIEHTKLVMSKLPLTCICPYPKIPIVSPDNCSRARRSMSQCTFFTKSLETNFLSFMRKPNWFQNWIDVPVEKECLHQVSGESKNPFIFSKERRFESSFYSLFPEDIRLKVIRADEEIRNKELKIEEINLKLKGNLSQREEDRLKEDKSELEREVQRMKDRRNKLLIEAYRLVEERGFGNEENLRLAIKLKNISDYVYGNLKWGSISASALLGKVYLDVSEAKNIKKENWTKYLAEYAITGVATETLRKRTGIICARLVSLPVNFIEVISYLIVQRNQINTKRQYLKKYIEIMSKRYPHVGIKVDFCEFVASAPHIAKIIYVSVPSARIRSGPSKTCPVIAGVRLGDALTVLDKEGSWYKIRLKSGVIGWIAEWITSVDRPEIPRQVPKAAPTSREVSPAEEPPQETMPSVM